MLELKDIVKIYPAGGNPVEALKGVSLGFRDSEFVSILGQSGCGKTTMLNIIGGLDQYTSGDLIINGRSTKDYKDRDWDTYRNHTIGFVFQTYNLIPHQNVLANVEIALSLSGVSKKERRERATEALKKVGLGDQLKKKPSEMSGGQMQRVAIARALVNNPDIILADEPTGALDTETSVQVMDILKEISKDKLVIMVTHNPELAEKYSTRIVRMLDGKITGDSAPFTEEEQKEADKLAADVASMDKKAKKEAQEKKPSMSFFTSFSLSLKNLFTKKGRTILTSFAGSIGIIGIALIYSVSQGTHNFIDDVQEDTISAYPLEIQAQTVDLSTLLNAFAGNEEQATVHEKDAVYQKYRIYDMMNSLIAVETQENDLSSFKKYIEEERAKDDSKLNNALSGVQYGYDLNLAIYTRNIEGKIIHSDTNELMSALIGQYTKTMFNIDMSGMSNQNSQSSQLMGSSMTLWSELLPGKNGEATNPVTHKQYDVVYGRWPEQYNEIVLFLDENNELNDYTLYALGLKTEQEITEMMQRAMNKQPLEFSDKHWSYQEICDLEFRSVLPCDCWNYDPTTGLYVDLRQSEQGLQYLYDNGMTLKVVGIVRPNEDAVSTSHHGTIGYTHMLTEYIINESQGSEVIAAQLESPNIDVTCGLPFKEETAAVSVEDKAAYFRDFVTKLDDKGKADLYVKVMSIPSESSIQEYVDLTLSQLDRATMEAMMLEQMTTEMGMDEATVKGYMAQMSDDDMKQAFAKGIREQYLAEYATKMEQELATKTPAELSAALDQNMDKFTDEECAGFYDSVLEFSAFTYDYNLIRLGGLDLDKPSAIRLYANSFENKDTVVDCIDEYNESVPELQKIKYTDYIGILMSSVTTIIDAITYVLIAFVAVSLIVSSIMIGVITLISVQERTKEIGILRSLGASKKNVSRMFNAETIIIGFTSGLLGVLITYLLLIPINIIVHSLTGLNNLTGVLPIPTAIILIIISMLLTLIAGIIPSRSAAKKDPVVALRTE